MPHRQVSILGTTGRDRGMKQSAMSSGVGLWDDATVLDDNPLLGPAAVDSLATLYLDLVQGLDRLHSLYNPPKRHILAIKDL